MKKSEIEKLKKHYLELKSKIIKTISNNDIETDFDGDDIDIVQAKAISDIASKLSQRQVAQLIKINSALTKIEDGSFGECEQCGNVIGFRRLEVIPGVEYCVSCAEQQEAVGKVFVA